MAACCDAPSMSRLKPAAGGTVMPTAFADGIKTVVLVGDGTAYASKKEATTAMGTIEACKST